MAGTGCGVRFLSLRIDTWKRNPKCRSFAWFRLKFEARIEQLAKTFDDREPDALARRIATGR